MSKFYFTPLVARKKISSDSYVNVSSAGSIVIPQGSFQSLGIESSKMYKFDLYEDAKRRALAFRIEEVKGNLESLKALSHSRIVKPFTTSKNYSYISFSIKPFIKMMQNCKLPLNRVEISKYQDSLAGELFYITIPETYEKPIS